MNGLANLLGSESRRTVKFSCGIEVVFKKYTLGDFAKREDEILRLRLPRNLRIPDGELTDEVKKAIVDGIQEGYRDITSRPSLALPDEDAMFTYSAHGRAFSMYLLAVEPKLTFEEAFHIYNCFNASDNAELDNIFIWATEADAVKN